MEIPPTKSCHDGQNNHNEQEFSQAD
jgi:hypothetical protein